MFKNFFEKVLKKENSKQILLILFAAIFVCLPLLSKNIDISYDDGVQHIARLIGTEASIKEGQTAIMSDFCNGFGYSWNLFYSPITAIMPLLFRIFGISYINCIKLFLFVVTFLSGITMYFFTKEVTKNKKVALLSAIVYIFAPYRFTDMYIRNAIAELTSFVFIPMVFQGLYGVLKQKDKRELILIIGSSLLILTHTIVAMYTAIICFIYVLTQLDKLKNKDILKKLIFSLVIIVTLTCFFWMPLLQLRFSADYEVFKPGRMERTDVLKAFKLDILDLFWTKKNSNMIYEIGLINVVVLLLTPFNIIKTRKKYKNTDMYKFYIFAIIMTVVLLIMTLKIFPFEKLPSILKMIQFTFRLLEFSSFFIAFIVAVNLSKMLNKFKYKEIIVFLILYMISTAFFVPHLHYINNLNEEWLIPAFPVTEKTGRVHAGCASFEYLPCKAFENRNYIETRNQEAIVLKGDASIQNQNKEKSKMSFQIVNNNGEEEIEIELPYIYYPGYKVTVETLGKIKSLNTFESDNGFLSVRIPTELEGKVSVRYAGTGLMNTTKIISLSCITILTVLYIIKIYKNKRG